MNEAGKRRSQAPRRLVEVDLEKIQHQFLVVLKRESTRMMDVSFEGKLSESDSRILINYLKLLKELKKSEEEDLDKMSDEELVKLANKEKEK